MNRSLVMPMTISFIVLSVALLLSCTAPVLPSMPSGFSGVPDRLPRAFPSSPERIGAAPQTVCDRAAYEAGFRTQYARHWNWVVHDKEVLYQVKSRQHPGDTAARRNYALYRGKEMSGQDAAAGNYGLRLDASGKIRNDCEARSFTQGETAGMREAGRDLEKLAAEEL